MSAFVINPYAFKKAFVPTDISGLKLWLDASVGLFDATSGGSAVTTDGSSVARWEDQSGNGVHATQATSANRPVLKTAIKNSKNVLRFDGSNDFLENVSTAFQGLTDLTMVTVSAPNININSETFYGIAGIAFTTNARVMMHYGGTSVGIAGEGTDPRYTWLCVFSGSNAEREASAFETNINSGTFSLGLGTYTTTGTELFYNGTSRGLNNAAQTGTFSSIIGPTPTNVDFRVGQRFGTSWGSHLNGDVAEVLIYDSVLTTAQRQDVETYLNDKYAIY